MGHMAQCKIVLYIVIFVSALRDKDRLWDTWLIIIGCVLCVCDMRNNSEQCKSG